MIDVTVKRSEWWRGKNNSALLRHDGNKCCLGFACLAGGLTEKQILGEYYPEAVAHLLPKSLSALVKITPSFSCNSDICLELSEMNDNIAFADATRELELTRLGKLAGINFTFVD